MSREENQDRVAIAHGKDLFARQYVLAALSDGIGGMKGGAECASIAVASFFDSFLRDAMAGGGTPEQWLLRAANESNEAVHEKFNGTGGATLAAVYVGMDGPCWLSVGDSRVYHSHGKKLSQLSVDDTIAGQLAMLGRPADETNPRLSGLLQFIGMGQDLEPNVSRLGTGAEGSVLLTSDGVHFLESEWIGQITKYAPDPGICAHRLTELAKWCGGRDNASAAVVSLNALANPDAIQCSHEAGYTVFDPFGQLRISGRNSADINEGMDEDHAPR